MCRNLSFCDGNISVAKGFYSCKSITMKFTYFSHIFRNLSFFDENISIANGIDSDSKSSTIKFISHSHPIWASMMK